MSPSYWKQLKTRRLERSRKGVLARERKRLAQAERAKWVGTIHFDGPAFNGQHQIRVAARSDEPFLLVDIDGFQHRPRSVRGLLRLICRRLWLRP